MKVAAARKPDIQAALLKKSVKRKIRYHVESLPAAEITDSRVTTIPLVRASRAGTEIFIKIYFWTGTRWANSS